MRRFLGSVLVGPAAFFALACDAPAGALTTSCTRTLLDPVECRFTQASVVRNQTASVDVRTKNLRVRAQGSFSIAGGKAAVVILGCAEGGRIDVEHRGSGRSAPVPIDCLAEVDRSTFLVAVDTFALGGEGRGLEGTLVFTPR